MATATAIMGHNRQIFLISFLLVRDHSMHMVSQPPVGHRHTSQLFMRRPLSPTTIVVVVVAAHDFVRKRAIDTRARNSNRGKDDHDDNYQQQQYSTRCAKEAEIADQHGSLSKQSA